MPPVWYSIEVNLSAPPTSVPSCVSSFSRHIHPSRVSHYSIDSKTRAKYNIHVQSIPTLVWRPQLPFGFSNATLTLGWYSLNCLVVSVVWDGPDIGLSVRLFNQCVTSVWSRSTLRIYEKSLIYKVWIYNMYNIVRCEPMHDQGSCTRCKYACPRSIPV